MLCGKCGTKNKEGSKFCSKCGAKLSESNSSVNNTSNLNNNPNDDKTKIILGITAIIVVVIILFTCYSLGMFGGETYDSSTGVNQGTDTGVSQVSLSSFPVSEAPNLAQQIASSGNANSVSFKGVTLTKAQVAYILTKSISMIGNGQSNGVINVGDYKYASNPSGANRAQTISNSQYIDMCNRFSSWIEKNHEVPNYIGINTRGTPDVSPTKMMNICINILVQYKNTGSLPTSVSV